MDECYEEEVLTFDTPLFEHIETTYLLTMVGSNRREQYMAEMRAYAPTRRVVVVHNRGYRACDKPDWVQNSAHDLWHANLYVLGRATSFPVLILEDDVQFLPALRSRAATVDAFLHGHPDVDLYSLGSIPFVSRPSLSDHLRLLFGGTSHAWIYTASGAAKIASLRPSKAAGWTHDTVATRTLTTYMHATPLAIQRFERSSNSELWDPTGLFTVYMAAYGDKLYPVHHAMGRVGGLFPVIITLLTGVIVCVVVLRSRCRCTHHDSSPKIPPASRV